MDFLFPNKVLRPEDQQLELKRRVVFRKQPNRKGFLEETAVFYIINQEERGN